MNMKKIGNVLLYGAAVSLAIMNTVRVHHMKNEIKEAIGELKEGSQSVRSIGISMDGPEWGDLIKANAKITFATYCLEGLL